MTEHTSVSPISGSMTALVTPFRGGEIDADALADLVERQIAAGADWITALGTTAETPTLTAQECDRVLSLIVETAAGRCRVMAGAGGNDTSEAISLCRHRVALGAEAILSVVPYYNRPSAEGQFRHFAAIAEAVDVPIVLYDVPARTGTALDRETAIRLAKGYGHVVAVKDASGRIDNVTALSQQGGLTVLCGDDALTWPFLAVGARGVISVLGNLMPDLMNNLVDASTRGDMRAGLTLHRKVWDLAGAMARHAPNPVPIKAAMALCGWITGEVRLPLVEMTAAQLRELERVLRRHEMLDSVEA